ncbi:MAG: sialate O-acetylesterase [Bacteroidales bacterium]|nr:sialate O-acetylesterase [Bacteroidales bacterium]
MIVCLLISASNINAKVKLPAVLSNNMVLQQQTKAKLWGEAKAHSKVTVTTSWNKKVYATMSDAKGHWLIPVSTPAAGGPYKISFSDGESVTLSNILIGEVWFCSGQSNMEMPMKGFDRQPVKGGNDIIARAKPATPIRMFLMDSKDGAWIRQFNKQPQTDCIGTWLENTSENVANASAAAYYFARYLQDILEIPVGIIISSRGGSMVENWMSKEAMAPFKEVNLSSLTNDDPVNDTQTPCVLYNSKIAPLVNFTIKGFLWYQGESNRDNPDLYKKLMPAFVKDIRSRWNIGDFPFYYVQIAPFNYSNFKNTNETTGPRVMEVQMQNMKEIPNCGMVTTLDVGNPVFIHPVDKETVGTRLAYWALAQTYGKKGIGYSGPIYQSMEIVENKIYINFDHAPAGVCPMWTDLKGFEIAGEDKIFYPAKAEVETKTGRLAVTADQVKKPVAVRYAYKNYVENPSLFGVNGLPASPFRTDQW